MGTDQWTQTPTPGPTSTGAANPPEGMPWVYALNSPVNYTDPTRRSLETNIFGVVLGPLPRHTVGSLACSPLRQRRRSLSHSPRSTALSPLTSAESLPERP